MCPRKYYYTKEKVMEVKVGDKVNILGCFAGVPVESDCKVLQIVEVYSGAVSYIANPRHNFSSDRIAIVIDPQSYRFACPLTQLAKKESWKFDVGDIVKCASARKHLRVESRQCYPLYTLKSQDGFIYRREESTLSLVWKGKGTIDC